MSDDFYLPSLHGVFGPLAGAEQLKARWLTPEGDAALAEAVRLARVGAPWQSALADLPYVEETFDMDDPSVSERDLRNAPLDGLDLSGADLRGAVLRDASVRGASLRGADLRGALIDDADFGEADLSDADLSGASGGARFAETRLDRAKFVGAVLPGSSFQRASVIDADFTGANLIGSDLSNVDLTRSVVADTRFTSDADVAEGIPAEGTEPDTVRPLFGILGATSTSEGRRARWETPEGRAALRRALEMAQAGERWQEALAHLPYVEETLDQANPAISGRDLRNAPLDGLDLTGADLLGAVMHEVTAVETRLSRASLRTAKIFDADLTGASLADADLAGIKARITLQGAHAERASFVGAVLEGCDFRDAVLSGADFSESTISYCDFSGADLAGVGTVNTYFGHHNKGIGGTASPA